VLVTVKRVSTGSILDRPTGGFLVQAVNVFNLFFLLVVNPLAALLLIARRVETIDLTHMTIGESLTLTVVEIAGAILYVTGCLLMAGALMTLGWNYQLGGSAPRPEDRLIVRGPYKLIRHPMYTAAVIISLGLAWLVQSWALVGVFLIYAALVLLLIPFEEERLCATYGDAYGAYQRRTRKLIPFVY